jgi:hypothetical protein
MSWKSGFVMLKPMLFDDNRGKEATSTPSTPASRSTSRGGVSMFMSASPVSTRAVRDASSGTVRKMIRSGNAVPVLS